MEQAIVVAPTVTIPAHDRRKRSGYKRVRGWPKLAKLSREFKEQLCNHIRQGNYIQTAMTALGLPSDFYDGCVAIAAKGNPYYRDFVKEVQKAEADSEIALTQRMLQGGKEFLPCATMLERRFRDRYGRSEKRQVEVRGEVTISVVNYADLAKTMRKEIVVSPRKRKIK